ncbi:nuclear transport factor 2 family protein [Sediminibacterium ginsengisoli]|nr:nuclear transport factor 2 family protein [Sediminibacterium ginsengisoli]
MKRNYLFLPVFLLLLQTNTLLAQKGIEGLISAEKKFAAYTAENNIKSGFLRSFDSAGLVFGRGQAFNAIERYTKAPQSPGVLLWEPEFAVVSAGGDFGFTTGPYTFSPQKGDSIVDAGNFSSIWKMNANGEWKCMADMGVSYGKLVHAPVTTVERITLPAKGEKILYDSLLAIENTLNGALQQGADALLPFVAERSWFNINNSLPVKGNAKIREALKVMPAGLVFQTAGGFLAPAEDLAYVYGKVVNDKKASNYMRVWIRENGKWVIALQVLNW